MTMNKNTPAQKKKNLALAGVLLALIGLLYAITVMRIRDGLGS